jgi:hypothetical protein
LTAGPRPLYSARFATPALPPGATSPCGGIGRRARLKIEFRKECWFDSGQGHQMLRSFGMASHPRLPDEASWVGCASAQVSDSIFKQPATVWFEPSLRK